MRPSLPTVARLFGLFALSIGLAACGDTNGTPKTNGGPWHCTTHAGDSGSEGERCDNWWECSEGTVALLCTRVTSTGRYQCECSGGLLDRTQFVTQSETCEVIGSSEFVNSHCDFQIPPSL
jgi:hypothetical protein